MTEDINVRHEKRMQRKQAVVQDKIEKAQLDKGVLVVLSGNGKGKSSSGFGMVARALGHGMRVGIVQFIKGRDTTGEEAFFRRFDTVDYQVCGDGFTWDTQNREQDMATARSGWAEALRMLSDNAFDLLLLDELNVVLKYGYLPQDEVLHALRQRPAMQHVIITGRGAPEELITMADTVTDMGNIKHAFKSGIRAQKGIEL